MAHVSEKRHLVGSRPGHTSKILRINLSGAGCATQAHVWGKAVVQAARRAFGPGRVNVSDRGRLMSNLVRAEYLGCGRRGDFHVDRLIAQLGANRLRAGMA